MTPPILIMHGDDEKIIFSVPSTSSDEPHTVTWDFDNGWMCDCKGCLLGHNMCKHILVCMDFMKFLNMSLLDDPRVFTAEVDV